MPHFVRESRPHKEMVVAVEVPLDIAPGQMHFDIPPGSGDFAPGFGRIALGSGHVPRSHVDHYHHIPHCSIDCNQMLPRSFDGNQMLPRSFDGNQMLPGPVDWRK
jgi:hypothetical protein